MVCGLLREVSLPDRLLRWWSGIALTDLQTVSARTVVHLHRGNLEQTRPRKDTCGLSGRGEVEEWRISHQELQRIQNEGLLPLKPR